MKDNDISGKGKKLIGNKINDDIEVVDIIIPSGWAIKCNSDDSPDIITTLTTTLGSDA